MAGKGKPLKGVGTAGPYSGDIKKGGKKNIFIDGKDKLFIRCSKESITKCYF